MFVSNNRNFDSKSFIYIDREDRARGIIPDGIIFLPGFDQRKEWYKIYEVISWLKISRNVKTIWMKDYESLEEKLKE